MEYYVVTASANIEDAPIFYLNNVATIGTLNSGTVTGAPTGSSADIRIGIRADSVVKMDGTVDEVRISNIARTAGWIETEYNNQSGLVAFLDFGAEEGLNRIAIIDAPITNYLTDGLVGHWTFNGQDMDWGSSTAEAIDRSGQTNHGDVIGATAASGISGQGLDFDGSDDYVNVSTKIISSGLSAYSVSAWAKSDGTLNNLSVIVGSDVNVDHWWYIMHNEGTDKFVYNWKASDTNEYNIYSNSTVVEGQWYHLLITNDGFNQYLYIDGVQQTDTDNQSGFDESVFSVNIATLWSSPWSYGFNGLIDEVRIYNRALSEDEIGQLYRIGAREVRL